MNGQITRVWRYRSQPQSESVQLEDNGDSRGNDSFEIFGATRDGINLPGDNFSPDGRFSIFGSHTSGSRVDVFIAAVKHLRVTFEYYLDQYGQLQRKRKLACEDRRR